MANLRQQLTKSYAIALVGTALLLAGAVWIGSLYSSDQRLALLVARQQAVAARAEDVMRYIGSIIEQGLANVTTMGPSVSGLMIVGDTVVDVPGDSTEILASAIRTQLGSRGEYPDSLVEYLVVYSRNGNPLYASGDLLTFLSTVAPDSALTLLRDLGNVVYEGSIAQRRLLDQRLVFATLREPSGLTSVEYVVVGTLVPGASTGSEQVFLMVLLVAPLVIVLSLYVGYTIAGRPLEPVEQLINEVEAITDGRSLHKRLAIQNASAELSRLSTTLNAMMERLEKSFTALRTFTADASHELNTPLAVLRADVERAMNPNVDDVERLEALEESLREIRRMSDLVDSLLTLARADEGRLDLHMEPIDLTDLVQEVYETALLLGEDAALDVQLAILEPATVAGDRGRLRQLFLNLVSNAIKYTPAGGKVELSLSRRLDGVTFSVKDTGIGIAAADLPYIFERFWRADHSRSRAADRVGFGLGLPICNWIALAHGGSISATSKLGKGSTFTVSLPLHQDVIGSGNQE